MEYEIEKVLDERTLNGAKEFLIKWKGYTNKYNSWEPENNFNGGDPGEEGENSGKYIDYARTVNTLKTLAKGKKLNHKTIEPYWGERELSKEIGPKIFIYLKDQHYYTIIITKEKAYIADGANSCQEKAILNEIEKTTLLKLHTLTYKQQTKPYHCAADAILIGLIALSQMKRGEEPEGQIAGWGATRKELVRRLYGEKETPTKRREGENSRI